MEYKILESNSADNEFIDGAMLNHLSSGYVNGIIKGALNECKVFSPSSNSVSIETGVLVIQGFRVKITQPYLLTFTSQPSVDMTYSIVASLKVDSNKEVTFDIFNTISNEDLIRENILKTGFGTYQVEIAKFTYSANNEILKLIRTLPIIENKIDLSNYQQKADESLNTESKEIVGAINELKESVESIKIPEVSGGTTVTVNGEAVKTFDADTKVDKFQGDNANRCLYGIAPNGSPLKIYLQSGTTANRDWWVPIYNSTWGQTEPTGEGRLISKDPIYPYQLSTRHYVDDKFNGANKAVSFVNYSSMITSLNALDNTAYIVGQNIMIVTLNVPDLWVSEVMTESATYEYVSDTDFTALLETQGYVQVGYYKLSALETQKVDLTDYATKEALDGKVDKVLQAFKIYGTKDGGIPTTYSIGWSASANIVPIYDRSSLGGYNSAGEVTTSVTGAIKTAIPEKPDHATPKKYVDEKTGLYQHQVTFKFYRISDNFVIDSGTLVILSKSATLIDNVEELRKYVGRAVFADCTAGNGVTIIDDNSGTLQVTIGEASAIIYDSLTTTEATTLEDSVIEL